MDRALGALMGVALGDALGMPSQTLPRARIAAAYGRITDLIDPVADHPVSHGLRAGMVTDDTEQTLLLADLMIRSPAGVDDRAWAGALLDWERDVRARGLRDLLGPSSKRALDALLAGVPARETGREGTTNGAAMRIAPVGIATPPGDPAALVARLVQLSGVIVDHIYWVEAGGLRLAQATLVSGVRSPTIAPLPENLHLSVAEPDLPCQLQARPGQKIFGGAWGTCLLDWRGAVIKAVSRVARFRDLPDTGPVWVSWQPELAMPIAAGSGQGNRDREGQGGGGVPACSGTRRRLHRAPDRPPRSCPRSSSSAAPAPVTCALVRSPARLASPLWTTSGICRGCTGEARLPCTSASLGASWTMSAEDRDREASVA